MLVLDDYLDRDLFLRIKASIETESFIWQESLILKPTPENPHPPDNEQFVHGFYLKNSRRKFISPSFELIKPIIDRLAPIDLIKAKINLTARKDRHIEYGLHVDTRRAGATTAILYLNTNNGYTLFEDGVKVGSVANRMVIFDSTLRHTGASCTDTAYRLVLNINMILAKDAAPE